MAFRHTKSRAKVWVLSLAGLVLVVCGAWILSSPAGRFNAEQAKVSSNNLDRARIANNAKTGIELTVEKKPVALSEALESSRKTQSSPAQIGKLRSTLPLRLVGADFGGATPQFIVENLITKTQDIFQFGDFAFGLAKVLRGNSAGLELDEGNGKITFLPAEFGNSELGDGRASGSGAGLSPNFDSANDQRASHPLDLHTGTEIVAASGPVTRAAVRANAPASNVQGTAQVYEFNSAEISRIAAFPGAVIAETAPVLAFRDGKLIGVQLSAVDESSVAKKAGFQSGDIVTSIEGKRISDPFDIATTLLSLKNPFALVTLEREGKTVKLMLMHKFD